MNSMKRIFVGCSILLSVSSTQAGGFDIRIPTLNDIKNNLEKTFNDIGKVGNDVGQAAGHLFGPEVGHWVREGANVFTLGEVGRATDRERAQDAAAEANVEKRIEDARVQEHIMGLRQLINDQYQAYLMTRDNLELSLQAKMQMSTMHQQLQDVADHFAEYEAAVVRIQDANTAEMELLDNASKYSEKLAIAIEDFSTNGDSERITNFYNRAIDRARAYRISTKKYIGLILAKSAMGDQKKVQNLSEKLAVFNTSLMILKRQIDAIVTGETNQTEVHLSNMRTYMSKLKNFNMAYCGLEAGLPPCDLFKQESVK